MRNHRLLPALAGLSFALAMPGTLAAQTDPAEPSSPSQPEASAPEKVPVRRIDLWNLPKRGEKLAIKGYDPVAYFPEGGGDAKKGSESITHTHKGVVYRFVNATNRDLFKSLPSRYEPAHGGWCSWAMREGDKVEVDPKTFIVKDDRLFLFYNGLLGNTKNQWLKTDHKASADEADAEWKKISGEEKRAAALPKEGGEDGGPPTAFLG